MLPIVLLFFLCTTFVNASYLFRRDDGPPSPGSAKVAMSAATGQNVPRTAKAPNTFSNGQPQITAEYPYSTDPIPDIYQPRDIDIPFGRMVHGNLTMFPQGQLNDPSSATDQWTPNVYDFANQSACGIPDNAYWQGKAAIHPYWLKYAGLDRYCMPDVCISIWPEGDTPDTLGTTPDMLIKVTDICSTNPSDSSYCATPADIKMDRAKVQILYGLQGSEPELKADRYTKGGFWHISKCWTNALYQPAYQDNWFAQPPLPNNFHWDVDATKAQMQYNQASYPERQWETYPDGAEIPTQDSIDAIVPITDWVSGQEPAWAPIAGGKGFGTPERSHGPAPALWPGLSTALANSGSSATNDSDVTTPNITASNLTASVAAAPTRSSVLILPGVASGDLEKQNANVSAPTTQQGRDTCPASSKQKRRSKNRRRTAL